MPSILVSKATAKWMERRNAPDSQRAKFRAIKYRRVIDFWETIRDTNDWLLTTDFAASRTESRWIRRLVITLELAGIVEVQDYKHAHPMQFRVIRRARP